MGNSEKYRNRYRIASTRLQTWDYSKDAAYYITICTKNRECCFGTISSGKMHLSHLGILADVFWHEIKNHANNVDLGAFVVMPNHIHGILWLVGMKNLIKMIWEMVGMATMVMMVGIAMMVTMTM
jgi:putative transposase